MSDTPDTAEPTAQARDEAVAQAEAAAQAAAQIRPFQRPDVHRKLLGLVVHGTGGPRLGSMLRCVAEEFLPLVRKRLDPEAGIAAKPLDEGDPAEVSIWFRDPAKREVYELRFLEVWWAQAFEALSLGGFIAGLWGFLLAWCRRRQTRAWGTLRCLAWLIYVLLQRIVVGVAVSVLVALFLPLLALTTLTEVPCLRAMLPGWLASTHRRLVGVVTGGQPMIVELLIIVLSPLLVLLLLLLWLVESVGPKRLLPAWLLDAHRSLVNMVTRHVGDLSIYMRQAWDASQIRVRFEERLHQVVELLQRDPQKAKVEGVFVIAYSMGSVVAYEALTGRRMTDLIQKTFSAQGRPTFHFISVGSPLNAAWDVVPESERFRLYREFAGNVHWLNLWSEDDPVPRGELRPPYPNNIPDLPVVNQMDLFSDHFAYWNNAEQVIAPVLDTITQHRLSPALQMDPEARRSRVGVLAALKALAWLVFPAVYLPLAFTGAGQWISDWAERGFLDDETWQRYVVSPALWAAAGAAAAVALYSTLVKWAWDLWDGKVKYHSGPVKVLPYDPQWPLQYEEERARIDAAIGSQIAAIEHVGSTAVPGLGAKPIIDIMVGLRQLADGERCISELERLGYEYEGEAGIPGRLYFRRFSEGRLICQIHMVEEGSELWQRHLLFRDYLREHAKEARDYYQRKKRLAARYRSDREKYTEAKARFIEAVVAKARAAKEGQSTD